MLDTKTKNKTQLLNKNKRYLHEYTLHKIKIKYPISTIKTNKRHPSCSISIGTKNEDKIEDPKAMARELVPEITKNNVNNTCKSLAK